MGPVWADMLVNGQRAGQLDRTLRCTLLHPGLPYDTMFAVVPTTAPHPALARQYVEFLTAPKQQAEIIVGRMGWFPGIAARHVLPWLSPLPALFQDVPVDTLKREAVPLPAKPYFRDLINAYNAP